MKCSGDIAYVSGVLSPSMRREWIEIDIVNIDDIGDVVSLHAEGVD